jgi:DNA replication protein DnaC
MAETLTPKLKTCTNCPPLVVPRRGYTLARPSCIECVEKHLGAAYVLLAELNDLPDARRIEPPNRRVKAAGFRDQRTLEDFDFAFNPSIKKKQVFDLAAGRFIRDARDVLLLGPPGGVT